MMTFNFTGEGIAAIVASVSALVGTVSTVILQLQQKKISQGNAATLADNTAKLDASAQKIDDVHAATNVLVASATGSHEIYKPPS